MNFIKLLIAKSKLKHFWAKNNSIFFHTLKNIVVDCVDREEYIQRLSKGKKVLHFGFLDSPFCEEKIRNGELLHLKIKKVASYLCGLDINLPALQIYREKTKDENNSIFDLDNDFEESPILLKNYDLILLPEVLEHLENPGRALKNLYRLLILNPGSKLCITVPNAFFAGSFFAAMNGNEVVHPDHNYYFSPITLRNLLSKTGFSCNEILVYYGKGEGILPGVTQRGIIAVCEPRVANAKAT